MTSRSHAYLLSFFCCRLIIIILNPNPSPSLSTHSSYNRESSRCLEGKHAGELLKYENIGEFLADIRKEFGGGDEELVKVA